MATFYPAQPQVSCQALIRNDGQILVVQRGREPFAGYWSLPGGGVALGETLEDAMRRELREETGLDLLTHRYLGCADAIDRDESGAVRLHYVIIYLEGTVSPGTPHPGDDASDVRWMTPSEARTLLHTDSVARCLDWAGL